MSDMPVPFPDRYNVLGQWKPLFYRGNTDHLFRRAESLSDDPDIQGSLLYVLSTGKLVLEYVVRTTLRLPVQNYAFGDDLHLWLCPTETGVTYGGRNVNLYDGWHVLRSLDPSEVEEATENIRRAMNRMAFAFRATVDWRVKYSTVCHTGASTTPTSNDMPVLDTMLSSGQSPEEDAVLDAAMDWYNRGSTSSNPLFSFLCYYIAIESIVLAVTDGTADFNLGYAPAPKQQVREERAQCVRALYETLYDDDPLEFVQRAYFDCVVGLNRRLREVAELVFGYSHPSVSLLLDKVDGESLASIRSRLAHGQATSANKADRLLVSRRLQEIADVAHEFLFRVIFRSRSTRLPQTLPTLLSLGISMSDPRAILFTSDWATMERYDWRIRPEWCD